MLKFIHAADIHLDSTLKGLDAYDGAPAERIRGATRRALENLVQLALDESAAFVLIAGDLYDGDWCDYGTPLFFLRQMARLCNADIPVFIIRGNHDAANKMTNELKVPPNVTIFDHVRPETKTLAIGSRRVAIHGQSYSRAAIHLDLAAGYPEPLAHHLNIGLLHSCVESNEHERYAPCSVADLVRKGYDYWALGHVHSHQVLNEKPAIVFAGNLQGRHIREAGSKGCVLVSVDEDNAFSLQFRALDVVRWKSITIDVAGTSTRGDVLSRVESELETIRSDDDNGRLIAIRVTIAGESEAHNQLAANPQAWAAEVKNAANTRGRNDLWIEEVKIQSTPPRALVLGEADSSNDPFASIERVLDELRSNDDALRECARADLVELKKRLEPSLSQELDDVEMLREILNEVGPLLRMRVVAPRGETSDVEVSS